MSDQSEERQRVYDLVAERTDPSRAVSGEEIIAGVLESQGLTILLALRSALRGVVDMADAAMAEDNPVHRDMLSGPMVPAARSLERATAEVLAAVQEVTWRLHTCSCPACITEARRDAAPFN